MWYASVKSREGRLCVCVCVAQPSQGRVHRHHAGLLLLEFRAWGPGCRWFSVTHGLSINLGRCSQPASFFSFLIKDSFHCRPLLHTQRCGNQPTRQYRCWHLSLPATNTLQLYISLGSIFSFMLRQRCLYRVGLSTKNTQLGIKKKRGSCFNWTCPNILSKISSFVSTNTTGDLWSLISNTWYCLH